MKYAVSIQLVSIELEKGAFSSERREAFFELIKGLTAEGSDSEVISKAAWAEIY